jgi:hypothetical protein
MPCRPVVERYVAELRCVWQRVQSHGWMYLAQRPTSSRYWVHARKSTTSLLCSLTANRQYFLLECATTHALCLDSSLRLYQLHEGARRLAYRQSQPSSDSSRVEFEKEGEGCIVSLICTESRRLIPPGICSRRVTEPTPMLNLRQSNTESAFPKLPGFCRRSVMHQP